jgi:Peptidase A4 family
MRLTAMALFFVLATTIAFAQPPVSQTSAGPIRDKVEHGDGTKASSNWAGYSIVGSSFTSAQGSWIVPAANCSGVTGDQYAALWVGLDGDTSPTVEQIGTHSDCLGSDPVYYAWYEFYPGPSELISTVPVKPGDRITASVVYTGDNNFTLSITDVTTGKSLIGSATFEGAKRASAEWIVEAPSNAPGGGALPMTDFGTAHFGEGFTGVSTTNYAAGPIGSFGTYNVEMISKAATSSSPQTATCSALEWSLTSFSCVWEAAK